MHKFIYGFLATVILVVSGLYACERYSSNKKIRDYNNELSRLEGVVKETETAYSRRAIEVGDLEVSNKELRKKIEDRDEEVLSLAAVNLRLKNKIIEIANASEPIVAPEGNETELTPDCATCLEGKRFKVDFYYGGDFFKFEGFTLTNPAEANMDFQWTRDIKLTLVLAKGAKDTFRIYVDSENSDIETSDLTLKVDPNILKRRWWENFNLIVGAAVGEGISSFVGVNYEFFEKYSVGPMFSMYFDGGKLRKMYGVSFVWYPLRF